MRLREPWSRPSLRRRIRDHPMSAPIAYRKPKSARLVLLFALSIGVHVGVAVFAIWAGKHLGFEPKPEEMLDLGMCLIEQNQRTDAVSTRNP